MRLAPIKSFTSGRQAAQDFVEYGLVVAAIAFVGMIGFNAVGRAEETLLKTDPLNAPPPAAGYFLHPTQTSVTCQGTSPYIIDSGTRIICTATVQDTYQPAADDTTPNGQVHWHLDGATLPDVPYTCTTLTPDVLGTSTCTLNYSPTASDVVPANNPHTLWAGYDLQSTNHSSSDSRAHMVSFTLVPKLDFAFQCNDALDSSKLFQTQIGEPSVCSLHVTDDFAAGNRVGQPVSITSSPVTYGGFAYFNCWTGNSVAVEAACPGPAATWNCTTDGAGLCVFEFRLTLDDRGYPHSQVQPTLTASALGQTSLPSAPIVTGLSPANHPSGVVLHCSGTGLTVQGYSALQQAFNNFVIGDQQMSSNAHVARAANCTAVVMDLAQNPLTFDISGPNPCRSPCNIDQVNSTPPLGQVSVLLEDRTNCGVNGCAVINTLTCNLGHLTQGTPVPPSAYPALPGPAVTPTTFYPDQPLGQHWNQPGFAAGSAFASWCGVSFAIPVNSNWLVTANYGGSLGHLATPMGGGFDSQKLSVNVN